MMMPRKRPKTQAIILGAAGGTGAVGARRGGRPDPVTLTGGIGNLDPGPVTYLFGDAVESLSDGFQINEPGLYTLSAGLRLSSQASAPVQLRIRSTNSGILANQSGDFYINTSTEMELRAGEYIRIEIFNNGSTVTAETFTNMSLPYLAVSLLGRT